MCVCFVVACIVVCGTLVGVSVCEYQSVECAFTSPVSIESSMLVTCRMQCLCPWCCSVMTSCLLLESMRLLL